MLKKLLFLIYIIAHYGFSQNIAVDEIATGFDRPVNIQNAGDDRLFIIEQDGVIKILNADGTTNSTPFLDIDSIVRSVGNEQGLLGLAFDPDYTTNGFFYVNYTNNSGNTVVARYSVSANTAIADASSAQILLTISQPYSNHNGGSIVFGADNYLYIGMGDGGSGGDPDNNAQNGNSLLGKILRIEVGAASTYSIPADNPFVGNAAVLDEIWATGIRNPWKFSFDSQNGDIWIGDVGQSNLEEIDHTANGISGLNYGWRCYEGTATYNTSGCGSFGAYTNPVAEYSQGGSPYKCAVTGGFVYRGSLYPNFNGLYFFADYCSSEIRTLDPSNAYQMVNNTTSVGNISTFGEGNDGELYVAGLTDGKIYKIRDTTVSVEDNIFNEAFVLHPNPSNGLLKITNKNSNYTLKNVEIFNSIGARIYLKTKASVNIYNLDVQHLKQGVYFLNLTLNNNKTITKKLIIN